MRELLFPNRVIDLPDKRSTSGMCRNKQRGVGDAEKSQKSLN